MLHSQIDQKIINHLSSGVLSFLSPVTIKFTNKPINVKHTTAKTAIMMTPLVLSYNAMLCETIIQDLNLLSITIKVSHFTAKKYDIYQQKSIVTE